MSELDTRSHKTGILDGISDGSVFVNVSWHYYNGRSKKLQEVKPSTWTKPPTNLDQSAIPTESGKLYRHLAESWPTFGSDLTRVGVSRQLKQYPDASDVMLSQEELPSISLRPTIVNKGWPESISRIEDTKTQPDKWDADTEASSALNSLLQTLTEDSLRQAELWVETVPTEQFILDLKRSIRSSDAVLELHRKSQQTKSAKSTSIAEKARRYLRDVADDKQANQARAVLDILEYTVSNWEGEPLPQIYAAASDLSSTLFLEWAFPKSRLGFNIEIDPNESGWYLLIEQADGKLVREWGYMTTFNAELVVGCILSPNLI